MRLAFHLLLSFSFCLPYVFSDVTNYVEYDSGNIPILITIPHTGDDIPPDIENERSRPDAVIVDEEYIEEVVQMAVSKLDADHGLKPYVVRALFARTRIDANRDDQTGPVDDNEAYEDPDAQKYYDEYHNRITTYINEILDQYGRVFVFDTHGHGQDPSDPNVKLIYRGTRNGNAVEHAITAMGWGPVTGTHSVLGEFEAASVYTLTPANDDLPGPGYQPETILAGGWSTEIYGSEGCSHCSAVQLEIGRNSRETLTERQALADRYADGLYKMYSQYYQERVVDNTASNTEGSYAETGSGWSDSEAVDNCPENSLPNSKARTTTTDGDAAQYQINVPVSGMYEVYAWWSHERPASEGDPTPYPRNQNAQYTVTAASESFDRFVNQRENGGQWNLLYTGWFEEVDGVQVLLTHQGQDATVAEAVKVKLISTDMNYPPQTRNIGDTSDLIIDRHVPGPWSYEEIGTWGITNSPDQHGPFDVPDSRARVSDTVGDKMIWRPNLQDFQEGYYRVYAWWANTSSSDPSSQITRDSEATFRVHHAQGVRSTQVDQNQGGGEWVLLATAYFSSGETGFVELERTVDSSYSTVGDAIKFEFLGLNYAAQIGDTFIIDQEQTPFYVEGHVSGNVTDWRPTNSQNNYGPYPDSRSRISRNGGDFVEWTLEDTGGYTGKLQVETWWGNLKDNGVDPYSRDEDATFEVLKNGVVAASATWDQKYDAGQWNVIGEIDLVPGDQVYTRIIREYDDPINRRTTADAIRYTLTGEGAPPPPPPPAATVTRGPYLQKANSNSVTVRFYTDTSVIGKVSYGTTLGQLDSSVSTSSTGTKHILEITGLDPDTKYYYSVGTDSEVLEGGSDQYYFKTHPVIGTVQPVRVWLIGDSGTANSNARAVRDAYINDTGSQETDVWIMLGDNAYDDGTYSEYQAAVFDTYPTLLRNTFVWPTIGNHDGRTDDAGPYLDLFTLPSNGEVGGIASGTERYYSFDYANIHFVCLDSDTSSMSSTGTMANWLRNDLADTTQEWIIAYIHHPPYSKGSHDSDSESRLRSVRENLVPILEEYGVDMFFAGHSHSYERSILLNGHYGTSSTLSAEHKIDDGDGDPNGNGAYSKENGPNNGAVYIVAGSSGKTSGLDSSGPHPIFVETLRELGSVVLEINGAQADARFIDDNGQVLDEYQILKGPPVPPPPSATLEYRISNDYDDSEEDHEGVILRVSDDLELTRDDGTRSDGVVRGEQMIGLRFKNVFIPQGATINSASIQFTVDGAQSEETILTFRAEDVKSSAPFTTTQFDISSRTLTTASVQWNVPAWPTVGEQGPDQQTPDLSALIQEIVNRSDWEPNGEVSIIISGTGKREAESYKGDPNNPAVLTIEYGNGPPGNSIPSVSLTAPSDGSEYDEPAEITLTATASDSDGTIALVEFFEGSTKLGEDTTEPYSYVWNNVPAGTYQLKAVATDDVNASATSASVSVTVNGPNQAPTATVTSPQDGATYEDPAVVQIDVDAVDSDGTVTKVEFYVDGALVGEDTSAPYSFTWNGTLGLHSIYAVATDEEAATGTSSTIQIDIVEDIPNQSPSVSITSPQNGASFEDPATVSIQANASDSDGSVTLVEFYVDGAKVGEDTSSPYSLDWVAPGVGSYTLHAVATDNETATSQSSDISIQIVTPPVPGEETLEVRISASYDDVEEYENGTIARSNGDLELINDGSRGDQKVGLRFNNITIPTGAEITKAYVQFTVDEDDDLPGVKIIHGEASDNAPGFSSTAFELTNRSLTNAFVTWDPPVWNTVGEAGPDQQTSDLSPVIQEIVNRGGWASGSSLVLIISGAGERVAESYNGSSANAPLLHVEYNTSGSSQNITPLVSVTNPVEGASFEHPVGINLEADASDQDGTITSVEFFIDGMSVGTSLTAPYQVIWNVTTAGTYQVTALATDDGGASTLSNSVEIVVTDPPPEGQVWLDIAISQQTDDAEEDEQGDVMKGNSDLELVYDPDGSPARGNQLIGLRFNNVSVPQGKTIVNAYVQFTVDETKNDPGIKTIYGEASDNPSTFSSSDFNISSRPVTSASVTWDPPAWNTVGEAGPDQRTSDIASVIQEIVNRPGWTEGSSLVIIITGEGRRVAESFDGSAAPILHLEYEQ